MLNTERNHVTQLLKLAARLCNYGILEDYHGSLIPGETALAIVVHTKESLLAIGANLIVSIADHTFYTKELAELLAEAYIDSLPESSICGEYRVIYFPTLNI